MGKLIAAGASFFNRGQPTIEVAPQGDLATNIGQIINYGLGILGLVAVAFLIYAGVLMVTSGGDEEGVAKGRKIITYAVIGIVIIVLAYTIVQFVTSVLS